MKAIFPVCLFLFAGSVILYAQPSLPIDETTKKTVYTEVVPIDGAAASELFKRAEKWFNGYFKNPSSVLKEKDAEKGIITGQHGIYIYNDVEGLKNQKGMVKYFIKILLKEGKYKYEIDDIFLLASPKIYIEEWLNDKAPNKDVQFGYIQQVDSHIKALIADLKNVMAQPLGSGKTDDW